MRYKSSLKFVRLAMFLSIVAITVSSLSIPSNAVMFTQDFGDNFSSDPNNVGPLPILSAVHSNTNRTLLIGENIDFETATNTPAEEFADGDDGMGIMINGKWVTPEDVELEAGEEYTLSLMYSYFGNEEYAYNYSVWADTDGDGALESELTRGDCTPNGEPVGDCAYLNGYGKFTFQLPVDASMEEGMHGYIRSIITESSLTSVDKNLVQNPTTDYALDVIETADGNFVLLGRRGIDTASRMTMMKVTPEGELIWQYVDTSGGGAGFNVIESVDQNGNPDGFVAVGYINYQGDLDTKVIKVSNTGSLVWQRILTEGRGGYAVIQTTDASRDYVIAGSILSNPALHLVRLSRTNPTSPAADIFNRTVTFSGYIQMANKLGLIESKGTNGQPDGFVVAARRLGDNRGNIVKMNYTTGQMINQFNFADGTMGRDVIQETPGGSYLVSGIANNQSALLRVSTNLSTIQNTYSFAQYGGTWINNIVRTGANTYALGATYNQNGLVLNVNANGEILDEHSIGGSGIEVMNDLNLAQNGCFIAAGETSSFGSINPDFWFHRQINLTCIPELDNGEVEDYRFVVGQN